MTEAPGPTRGWYPHPTLADTYGYWDGTRWTSRTHEIIDPKRTGLLTPMPPKGSDERLYETGKHLAVLLPVVGVIIGVRLLLRDRLREGATVILASVTVWGLVVVVLALFAGGTRA